MGRCFEFLAHRCSAPPALHYCALVLFKAVCYVPCRPLTD